MRLEMLDKCQGTVAGLPELHIPAVASPKNPNREEKCTTENWCASKKREATVINVAVFHRS